MAGMPWFMASSRPASSDEPEKLALAVELSRITFPYLLFISLVALLSGVLNALYRFAAAAATPILLEHLPHRRSCWCCPSPARRLCLGLGVSVGRGGAVRSSWRWPRRAPGCASPAAPAPHPDVRRLLVLLVPGVPSGPASIRSTWWATSIASWQEGSISYLFYADRVYQLPLGVIGVAIGTALLPDMARQLRGGDRGGGHAQPEPRPRVRAAADPAGRRALLVIPGHRRRPVRARRLRARPTRRRPAPPWPPMPAACRPMCWSRSCSPPSTPARTPRRPSAIAVVSVVANIALNLADADPGPCRDRALATALAAWLNTALLVVSAAPAAFGPGRALGQRRRASVLAAAAMAAGVWGLHGCSPAGWPRLLRPHPGAGGAGRRRVCRSMPLAAN